MKLSVTSIASYLPTSTVHDEATFGGTTSRPGPLSLTPLQEAENNRNQADKQLADAEQRNLAWPVEDSVELGDADAEGDDDTGEDDYVKHPDGYFLEVDSMSPLGIRNKEGVIETLPVNGPTPDAQSEAVVEYVPRTLREIVSVFNQLRDLGRSLSELGRQ